VLSTLVIILLLLVVVFLVGYPLFRKVQEETFVAVKPTKATKAADEKAIIMSTLGEIEFDYRMNKLSEEDYQSLKHTYSGAAVALMKAEEEGPVKTKGKVSKVKPKAKDTVISAKSEIEQEIEADLAALDGAIGCCNRCRAQLKEAKQEYCHSCGERQY
jgi:hypothetical protein